MISKGTVIRSWVTDNCTWKQQTVLLSALRGCDGIPKNNPSKDVSRLFRFTLIKNADTSSGFMTTGAVKDRVDLDAFFKYMDALPIHYVFHLAHATAIVGYLHPHPALDLEFTKNPKENWSPKEYWFRFYLRLCNELHVNPETVEQLDKRLEDKF